MFQYIVSVLLLVSVTSLHCMQIPGAQLPTVSVLNVIKNDVYSGGVLLFSSVRTPLMMGAVALLKMLYHGGFSFSEICDGVGFAALMGPCLGPIIVGQIGALIMLIMGDPYNKTKFINSQQSFRARNGLRWLCAAFQSVIAFKQLQGMLARESADYFIKHPASIVFQ